MDGIFRLEDFAQWYWVVFGVVPMGLLFAVYQVWKGRALERFAQAPTLRHLLDASSLGRRIAKSILVLLAFVALTVTLWRPQGNPTIEEVRRSGRDVVFLLDVSKSMLATDLAPNRLERAKIMIADAVERMQGDRVALVVFAGTASMRCPLTHNHFSFLTHLERVDVETVARGGTNIGDAIRVATDRVFYGIEGTYKDIVLISDGDDQDSFPIEAAQEAVRQGARVFTVGLGDPAGTTLPGVRYRGDSVVSGLNEELLREIAFTHPEGRYVNVGTKTGDLGDLYLHAIATADEREGESKETRVWKEWYQGPLALALVLLVIEWCLSERAGRARRRPVAFTAATPAESAPKPVVFKAAGDTTS